MDIDDKLQAISWRYVDMFEGTYESKLLEEGSD